MGAEVQRGVTWENGLPRHGKQHIIQDIRGNRYGRLTVKEFAYQKEGKVSRTTYWLCECNCGNIKAISSRDLKSGKTKSCGCIKKEKSRAHCKSMATMCIKNRRLYAVWRSMKSRCLNPNRPEYKNYGGRGITICEEWRNSFDSFCTWALSSGYDENAIRSKCTIDRIDNDGNYEPDNCRWVDAKVQNNNKRNSRKQAVNVNKR